MSVETVPRDITTLLHAMFAFAGVVIASAVGDWNADKATVSSADAATASGDGIADLCAGTSRSISHLIPGHALPAQLVTSTPVL